MYFEIHFSELVTMLQQCSLIISLLNFVFALIHVKFGYMFKRLSVVTYLIFSLIKGSIYIFKSDLIIFYFY